MILRNVHVMKILASFKFYLILFEKIYFMFQLEWINIDPDAGNSPALRK